MSKRPRLRSFLPALLILAGAQTAHAEPAQEAASATRACLAAIIDGAPVADIKGQDVEIRRGKDPQACTVRVTRGDPSAVREAVLGAVTPRKERFALAKSRWDPNAFASRESFCNAPGRRHLMVLISTARPNSPVALMATVLESASRDTRCDVDEGLQAPILR
ncbi:hypothetical protein [Phenylobacterium sp.]|uniref:hypothetical protein n=1 Tax=Phenylobacterium sp. TaxID=1871053 RepID=UPI0039830343